MELSKFKLYQENTLTGEILWIGKSALSMQVYKCFNGTKVYNDVIPELQNENYAYVIMKVKIDAKKP